MDKKGQLDMNPQGGGGASYAHPILYLGIFIFVIPFLSPIIGWGLPRWISGIGIAVILVGAVLSIIRSGDF